MYLMCFHTLQYLFSRLFNRFFIYFLLTAKRYPLLWFWSLTDFILEHFLCLRLWGLQNREIYKNM